MKYIPIVAGILLGLLFLAASIPFFLGMVPPPPPGMPENAIKFMEVFSTSKWLHFVKACELVGAILVAIPLTRNLGLLVLGPIVINILAFNILIMNGAGMANPMVIMIIVLPAYLLWVERKAFAGLLHRNPSAT